MAQNEDRRRAMFKMFNMNPGQTLTEYSLLLLAVGLAAFTAFLSMGNGMNQITNGLITFLNSAISAL